MQTIIASHAQSIPSISVKYALAAPLAVALARMCLVALYAVLDTFCPLVYADLALRGALLAPSDPAMSVQAA